MRWVGFGMLALLLASGARAGDAEVAGFLLEKGKKAMRSREYGEAESYFRRALAEVSPLPEASFGLGDALERLERGSDALAAYQQCYDALEAKKDLDGAERALQRRASTAIRKLQRRFADLAKVNKRFVDRCMAYGKKHADSDPEWARKAYEMVLAVDPTHEDARARLAKLPGGAGKPPDPDVTTVDVGKEKTKTKPDGWKGTSLMAHDDLTGWSPGVSENWNGGKRHIVGEAGNPGKLNWFDDQILEGGYEVRVQMRAIRFEGRKPAYGVFIGGDGKNKWWSIVVTDDRAISLDIYEDGERRPLRQGFLADDFDFKRAHTMRVVVEPGDLKVYVGDREMFDYVAEDRDAFDGKVCLFIQESKVEFRDMEWKK